MDNRYIEITEERDIAPTAWVCIKDNGPEWGILFVRRRTEREIKNDGKRFIYLYG